jgi:hypothetical protein
MSARNRQRPVLDGRSLRRTGRTDLLGVRLKPETIELAKHLALDEDRTIGDIVERSIDIYSLVSEISKDKELLRSLEMLRPPSTRGRLPRLYSHLADEPVPERLISLAMATSAADDLKNRQTDERRISQVLLRFFGLLWGDGKGPDPRSPTTTTKRRFGASFKNRKGK